MIFPYKILIKFNFFSGSQTIRKGTNVIIFIYDIHLNAKIFSNPEKSDLEQFVDEHLISDKVSPYANIPFSAGSRNYIGK
jgi:cytochrome P450